MEFKYDNFVIYIITDEVNYFLKETLLDQPTISHLLSGGISQILYQNIFTQ
jgi:hypothetical protein